ncbi:MAG: hypothetical protein Q9203_004081 [Teloschistes exilis]
MSLQIKTNCISNTAGSTVTGTLHIHIHNDAGVGPLTIDHLAITLTGRAQTDIDHSTKTTPGCVFQARRLLFATKKTLIKDSTSIHASSSCTWDFELQIPSRCTAREASAHAFWRWDRFDADPRQRLPPAFASYSSSSSSVSTAAANAAIIYELRASALVRGRGRGQGEGVQKLESVEPIDFTTTRDIEEPAFCKTAARAQVALQSARLLPQEPRRRLHVPRRLKVAASSDPPPFAAFELVLRGSRAAVIGRPFALNLRIAHDDDRSTSQAGPKPQVFLSHVGISLRAHTSVRCWGAKCFKEKGECAVIHKGDEFADWEEEIQIDSSDLTMMSETGSSSGGRRHFSSNISSRSLGLPIPVNDGHDALGLNLRQHTTIPTYFVPSFRSFLISRSYSLIIDVAVNCAGKTFSNKFVTRNFLLLAQEYAPRPPLLKAVGSQRTSQTLMDEDGSEVVLVPKLLEYA